MIKYKTQKAYNEYASMTNLNMPQSCPLCGGDLEVAENGIVSCINPACGNKATHLFENAFRVLEVKGAGPAFFQSAASDGNTCLFDFFHNMGDFAEQWAGGINGKKVNAAFEKASHLPISPAKYLALFDMEGFGEKKLACLPEEILIALIEGDYDTAKLPVCEGFGELSIENFRREYELAKYDITQCARFFPTFEIGKKAPAGGKLEGKSFCFTGKAEAIGSRGKCEELVVANGGTISSVKKGLSYLVQDDTESGSSKSVKAKQLGIPVITSFEFKEMLGL